MQDQIKARTLEEVLMWLAFVGPASGGSRTAIKLGLSNSAAMHLSAISFSDHANENELRSEFVQNYSLTTDFLL